MLTRIEWETLNATADDAESLEQIFLMLYQGSQGEPFLSEVADAICSLTERGLLVVHFDPAFEPPVESLSYVWHGWFSMTAAGKQQWQEKETYFMAKLGAV